MNPIFDPHHIQPHDLVRRDGGAAEYFLCLLDQENTGWAFFAISKQGKLAKDCLTEAYVSDVLTVASSGSRNIIHKPHRDLVNYALGEGMTLFLLLVKAFKMDPTGSLRLAMEMLHGKGLKDANVLPIQPLRHYSEAENQELRRGGRPQMAAIDKRLLQEHHLGCVDPRIFGRVVIADLCENQWKFSFLGPIFSTSEKDTLPSINRSFILPWTKTDPATKSGAFGVVSEVCIHEAYIKDDDKRLDPLPESFALKRLLDVTDDLQREWDKEVGNIRKVSGLDHCVRFLTGFRIHDLDDTTKEKKHTDFYLLFEWADGGSLRDLHNTDPKKLDGGIIKSSIVQLLGMAIALSQMHEGKSDSGEETNMRHGDLKPENILRFVGKSEDPIGTLKIGDWGLAKQHVLATQFRGEQTNTKHATLHYEPPEVEHEYLTNGTPRSRLYDVWSMGCIILEHIIWLVYGRCGLKEFLLQMSPAREDNQTHPAPFYEKAEQGTVVHRVPKAWMKHMAEEPCCKTNITPLGDLLDIVRDRLLVVDLPPILQRSTTMRASASDSPLIRISPPDPADGSPSAAGVSSTLPAATRCLAKELVGELEKIVRKGDGGSQGPGGYWSHGLDDMKGARKTPSICVKGQGAIAVLSEKSGRPNSSAVGRQGTAVSHRPAAIQDYGDPPTTQWEFKVDNKLADSLRSMLGSDRTLQLPDQAEPEPQPRLCEDCRNINFLHTMVEFWRDTDDIQREAENGCRLCLLLNDAYLDHPHTGAGKTDIKFGKRGSKLILNETGAPVLSMFAPLDATDRDDIQRCLPRLPESGSNLHFAIAKQWLLRCDENHGSDCQPPPPSQEMPPGKVTVPRLPTRLIVVGNTGDTKVQLIKTSISDTGNYIALSHRWGNTPFPAGGITTDANVEERLSFGLEVSTLPATFRDAIICTRALGVEYLWIDSLCIIQASKAGPGDFAVEAKRMESVFSGAYCVIAASRASGMGAGFLGPREPNPYIEVIQSCGRRGDPLYISKNIDDFENHVLKGHLNTRAWVYQEHALARRTLFFTELQTYFECGRGVRCETMTWMDNQQAAFLGDPRFPELILKGSRREKISRFQFLYKTYSGLDLSFHKDRQYAIQGLESRLLGTLKAYGCLGIIDEGNPGLLWRSLLWVRKDPQKEGRPNEMVPILDLDLPSWSWMAYSGEIDYVAPGFGDTEWQGHDVRLEPWPPASFSPSGQQSANPVIVAPVRDIIPQDGYRGGLVYDRPGQLRGRVQGVKSVVLGIDRHDGTHHVLLVEKVHGGGKHGAASYRRVGAGSLPKFAVGETIDLTARIG